MSGETDAFAEAGRMLARHPALRVVNFHHTPAGRADALERQLASVARRFASLDEVGLARHCASGGWEGDRPGIVLAFYNGYRSNFDVARPLLDRYGLVGWFFVASGLVVEPAATQAAFAARNRMSPGEAYPDGRLAMSWDEVRALDGPHVVASHTRNHVEVEAGDADLLRREIVGAQEDLTAALGHPVQAFAANKGGPFGANATADRLIEAAGYRFVFSNLKVQMLPARNRRFETGRS